MINRICRTVVPLMMVLAAGLAIVITDPQIANAQWVDDPSVNTPVCVASGGQTLAIHEFSSYNTYTAIPDGQGGVILSWDDRRDGSRDIYVQRINADGFCQWTADGVPVKISGYWKTWPKLVSDGGGGAILTWLDDDSYGGRKDVYAQKVNGSGIIQWAASGIPVCAATNIQGHIVIASDGSGGAIIAWRDSRSIDGDIYAQRINSAGIGQWTADGVAICTAVGTQSYPLVLSDGSGGAIIAWRDPRGIDGDIYAQRINSAGIGQWTADGVAICTAVGTQTAIAVASDGAGGAIISWEDPRNGDLGDIYAQRITSGGIPQWTADGIPVIVAPNRQWNISMVSDESGGALITWEDARSPEYDIYAQRIDANGTPVWINGGTLICGHSGYQRYPIIINDGLGGAIISWYDTRNGLGNQDIYAQRVDGTGNKQWDTDGIPVSTASDRQDVHTVTSDGNGGAIVIWEDYRNGSSDIYAQKITSSGALPPVPELHTIILLLVGLTLLAIFFTAARKYRHKALA